MKKYQIHEKMDFKDVRDLVERAAEIYSDRTAYSYKLSPRDKESEKVSFPELRDDIRALSSELLSRGLKDKHCAVIGKFSYSWVRLYFSLLSLGSVIVPLDGDWSAEELKETVARADIEYLFIDGDLKSKAEIITEGSDIKGVVYMSGEDGETVDSLVLSGREKFKENPTPYFESEIDIDKLSLLVFTSGTTGKGKGVMLSQRAIISDMSEVIQYIDFGRKTVGVLPPHHTYGSSVMLLGHMMIGCEIYISQGLRYVVKEFKDETPDHLILVPLYLETFYRKMQAGIKEKGKEKTVARMIKISNFLRKIGIDLRKKFFSSLLSSLGGKIKMIISGGAPINFEIVKFFDAIGISTLNGYGITECAPIIAVNYSKHVVDETVGNILDIDDVKIAEPNEDGEGEICVKGPNVMIGYYKDEATTAEAFDEDGYFKTGDYGKIVGDRVLKITGRKKNLIILSNGKNVYPEEIEDEFAAVPGVIDIVVYEGESKRGREFDAIVAEIYPDNDFFEKNKIEDKKAYFQKFVDEYNRRAVVYKKIGILKVRDEEFPKNTLRKILRFKIDRTID